MARIDEIEKEMAGLRERLTTLGKEWQKLMGRKFSREMSKLFPEGITLEGIFQVDWNALGNGGYGQKWWDKITAFLDEQQHGVWDPATNKSTGPMPLRGVYRDGYNPNTNQVAFKVMMRQQEPVESQLGLLKILPLVKAHEGWKFFPIFEASCGEHGQFFSMRVSEDHQKADVWNDRDYRYYHEYESMGRHALFAAEGAKAVEEALAFIHARLPYERKDPHHDDEDEDDGW